MMEVLLTATALILVIVLVRFALRGRLSLRLQYALWLLVAVRLLVPVTLGSTPVSLLNAVPDRAELPYIQITGDLGEAAPEEPAQSAPPGQNVNPNAATGTPGVTVLPQAPAAEELPANTTASSLSRWLIPLWCAGMGAMALWFFCVNLSFRRKLKGSARLVEGADCPLPVYVSDAIPSPSLFGLIRPAVYLTPACLEDEGRMGHVLAHEYTHYRHGDHLWALVRCLCLTVYWFHPLVWWAAALSRRDCELACDEGALTRLGEEERTAYGRTLIGLTVARSKPADLLGAATTMTAGKGGLKERVLLIAQKPKMAAATALLVALICAVAVACTFTGANPTQEPEETPAAYATVEEALADLPAELAEQVTVFTPEAPPPNRALGEAVILAAYLTEGYDLYADQPYALGWICDLNRYDQAGFERQFLDWNDNSGLYLFARDDTYYYALQVPTDVQWEDSFRAAYEAADTAFTTWVRAGILSVEGMEPYGESDYLTGDYTYDGAHYDVAYYPYLHVTGDLSVVYALVLSQPATQGEGGIWCVERYYDDYGRFYPTRPDTDLAAADYYASLQNQADSGLADWALDPLRVCLNFAQTVLVHPYTHEDNFHLGDPYEGERTGEIYYVTPEEAVEPTLNAIAAGETVILSMGDVTRSITLDNGAGYLAFPDSDLIDLFQWTRLYATQAPDNSGVVTFWSEDRTCSLTVYDGTDSAQSIMRLGSDGVETWYHAQYRDQTDVFAQTIYTFLVDWVAGHDADNFIPDLATCSDLYLMDFILSIADGASAESAGYELGERFLARPGQVLDAIRLCEGVTVNRWPDYQGDATQWLAEFLASEFAAMGHPGGEEFLSILDEQEDAYPDTIAAIRTAYEERMG